MFEPMFKRLVGLHTEDLSCALDKVSRLALLDWSGQLAQLYEAKVLIYGNAKLDGQENITGYCNPEGFWYLSEDKLYVCKWHQMFNELANHELKVYMGSDKMKTENLTDLRREFERIIALVSMTNMYQTKLVGKASLSN